MEATRTQYHSQLIYQSTDIKLTMKGSDIMEERINKKLAYLYDMANKYNKLNKKTNNKYLWRYNGICEHIEALENLQNNINNEWDEAYKEDLKESI